MNDLLEDLLLAVDSLTDARYMRHNLVVVMQIASDIEEELLLLDISANVVMAWSRLHADLDLLAKMNGINWSEAVITHELIATPASDANSGSRNTGKNDVLVRNACGHIPGVELTMLPAKFSTSTHPLRPTSSPSVKNVASGEYRASP